PEGTRPDPSQPGRQIPFYKVAMGEVTAKIHRDVPATRFWGYGGSFPGPTLETRAGEGVLVEWVNQLPARHFLPIDHSLCGAGHDRPDVRAVVHVHGAKAPPESDGYPEDWTTPGRSSVFHYPNRQAAATLWYHDHAMGIERLNQYAGLLGVYLIRDPADDALGLPAGANELPLVLCDRLFGQDGQLRYSTSGAPERPWVSEIYCDAHLVNGKLFPFLEVRPERYRFRVVNASNARFYYLALSNGATFHQVGTDQGLLPAPVPLTSLTLAPAERADLVVDFAPHAGTTVVLESQTLELLQLRVAPDGAHPVAGRRPLPAKLRPIARTAPALAVKTRRLTLDEYHDMQAHRMLMLLDGKRWHEPVTERPELDSVEIWELMNLTEDSHPIHLHLVRFQILDRQLFDADGYKTSGKLELVRAPVPPAPNEAGWKDTVRVDPGTITRIIVKFEGYPGRYVWHCHLLEHAANEMMRPFEVVPRSRSAG
ncbi:MAG TPA: multicopper oxidase domain-containing protein, partial [Polyangia bacterium]|nr:multicopper oxidase domain-containing protein [Polyangia bacterium]